MKTPSRATLSPWERVVFLNGKGQSFCLGGSSGEETEVCRVHDLLSTTYRSGETFFLPLHRMFCDFRGALAGRVEGNLSEDDTQFWLGLTKLEGLGVRGAHRLVEHFGSPQAAYMASLTELESCGIPAHVAQSIFAQAGLKEAARDLEASSKTGCRVVAYSSDDYPPLLKQTPDPALLLYVRGDVKVLSHHGVAIVGTRRPTAYGSQVAQRLARDLAQRQLVIVSGLARGIDSAAHRGALEAGGKTVAVLGSGNDVIYPRENKRLANKLPSQAP